jgi:hypothetical protein
MDEGSKLPQEDESKLEILCCMERWYNIMENPVLAKRSQ